MAEGLDPNRNQDTDRELSGEEQRHGGGLGNPDSSRLGFSSGATALLALLLVGIAVFLLM